MKPLAALCIICLILFSCKSVAVKHMPAKKMQAVLQDIHLAEAYSVIQKDSLSRNNDKNLDSLATYYKLIFKHHNTNQEEFDESLRWYKQNPQELDSVYAKILDQVTLLEAKYNIRKPL